MRILIFLLLISPTLIFPTRISALADLCFFGYLANDAKTVDEMYDAYDISPNIGVIYGNDFDQYKETSLALNKHGAKVMLLLADLIFERVTLNDVDCSDYESNNINPNKLGLRLYDDWEQKLTSFFISEKEYLKSGKIVLFAIADEVNNVCVSTSDVDKVSRYIKSFNTGIPTAVVYDLSAFGPNLESAMPLPTKYPESVDIIAVFEYGIFDPLDSDHPLNATDNWAQRWSNFKNQIGSRKTILILNAFCNHLHIQLGWVQGCSPEYVKPLAVTSYKWRDWALLDPDVIGIVAFNWSSWNYPQNIGVRDMHQVVQNSHRNIINAIECDPAKYLLTD